MNAKPRLIGLMLLTASAAFAEGHRYYVHIVTASHQPTYTTAEFESVNGSIQRSLFRDDLIRRAEVFVIPSGPGYKVFIGEKEPQTAVSEKERDYIVEEVRRLMIEVRKETQSKNSEKKANQTPQTTTGSSAPSRV